MKSNYYDVIGYKAWKAHCKAEALRYFYCNFQDIGSAKRDSEAIAGISYILEEISNEVRQVHDLLCDVKRPPLDTSVNDIENYGDGYPEIRIKVENLQ